MSQWCVESYPSSLYKFEIFSKLMFLAFWRNSGRDQGGPNPCLVSGRASQSTQPYVLQLYSVQYAQQPPTHKKTFSACIDRQSRTRVAASSTSVL